jgi:hypothetical protein
MTHWSRRLTIQPTIAAHRLVMTKGDARVRLRLIVEPLASPSASVISGRNVGNYRPILESQP